MSLKLIRFFDVIISLLFLTCIFPLMIIIAILIKTFDGSPIIFKQPRIGHKGKIFYILKFRTMNNSVLKNDKLRLTYLGKILRKTSLDETPQFINVLKKDMSIVGPRPLPKEIENKINKTSRIKRRKILPGITGLSQINYSGKNRSLTEKVSLDIQYVDSYGLYSYLLVLINTPVILITRFLKNKSTIIK